MRFGGGLLYDERASDGVLGGGQLALEIRLSKIPIGFQITDEYWTKGRPSRPYEISNLRGVNILLFGYFGHILSFLYTKPVTEKTDYVYLGGGAGRIVVPKIENPEADESGVAFNAVCGANIRLFWKIDLFVEGKYIRSSKITIISR